MKRFLILKGDFYMTKTNKTLGIIGMAYVLLLLMSGTVLARDDRS